MLFGTVARAKGTAATGWRIVVDALPLASTLAPPWAQRLLLRLPWLRWPWLLQQQLLLEMPPPLLQEPPQLPLLQLLLWDLPRRLPQEPPQLLLSWLRLSWLRPCLRL